MVSVIIPCFRQGHLLGQAIDSALGQTHPAVEVIVVNDGSDDDTDTVVRGYGSRVRYLERANGGVSAARNAGAAAAAGKFLLFLDADDLLHRDAVARLVAATADEPRVALMGHREFTVEPQAPVVEHLPPPDGPLLPLLFRTNFAVHAFLCPQAAFHSVGGFDERLKGSEDWELWVRLALSGVSAVTLPWAGAYYRRSPDTASGNRLRMAEGKVALMSRVWQAAREREEFWSHWVPTYLRTLYAVRRQCRILGWRPGADVLTPIIATVRARGGRVESQSPAVVRLQDRLPPSAGDAVEQACLWVCRWLRPQLYDALGR